MPDLFVGVDAGSSVCKAAVFAADGTQVALASRPTPLSRPRPGWVEADPERCVAALFEVLSDVVARSSAAGTIRGLGLAGAMVGAWLVDAQGQAVRPGINWEDSRSQGLIDALISKSPGFLNEVFSTSGSVLQQGCTLPVLAWLKRNEPAALARTAHVLSYKDFLRLQLTGRAISEPSEACMLPGDARVRTRSENMLSLFGLSDLTHLLPGIVDSAQIAGSLTGAAAARTGLPEGLPVVAGAGDVPASIIGAGGMEAGAATAVLGTTCQVGVCRSEPVFEPSDLGLLFSLPERRWYRSMVNVAGTLNIEWLIGLLTLGLHGRPDTFDRITQMVASVPPGARGVTYLPYLSAGGIIAPVVSARARAQFCGLHAGHDQACLLRAAYEGVAFAIADLLDLLQLDKKAPLTLVGGGSRSTLWCTMIADITRRSVQLPQADELGALGAALLAATALGKYDSVIAASTAARRYRAIHTPRPGADAAWSEPRSRFIDYRDRLLREAGDQQTQF